MRAVHAPGARARRPQAYNKRATLLYILERYEESIQYCRKTLSLQSYHFGAASGMGLC